MTLPRTFRLSWARPLAAALALVALLAVQLAAPTPASAHARLEATGPEDGSSLSAAPPEVMLQFNETINSELSEVSVTTESTDVAEGSPEFEGNTVYQGLESSMPKGDYTVTYKVVSADGHPVSGSFSFTYAPPGEEEQEGVAEPTGSSDASDEPTSGDASGQSTSTASESPSPETNEEGTSSSSTTSAPATGTDSPTDDSGDPAASSGDATGSEALPGWVWGAGAAGLALVIGGIVLLSRGRRSTAEEEAAGHEEWRE